MDIEQQRRVVTEIPGPKSRELLERRLKAVPRGVFGTVPIFVESAFGAIVRDVDGNDLIDLGAGLAVLNTGNSAPAVVEAATEQLERFSHTCFHVTLNEPYVELAERLNRLPRATRSAGRCSSIPGRRPSRTRSRSRGTSRSARPWSWSITPSTAEPSWRCP
jgi:4-aminobutyrate aminotransferase-like enzyme